jgi:hypothetical protein
MTGVRCNTGRLSSAEVFLWKVNAKQDNEITNSKKKATNLLSLGFSRIGEDQFYHLTSKSNGFETCICPGSKNWLVLPLLIIIFST